MSSAVCNSALEGMHPTLRHTPPKFWCFSIRHTRCPRSAARKAVAYPPGPAPITTRSNDVSVINAQLIYDMSIIMPGILDKEEFFFVKNAILNYTMREKTGDTMSDQEKMPTLAELTEQFALRVKGKESFGKTAKLAIEALGDVYIDATGSELVIDNRQADADVTLKMSLDTLMKMGTGELDGMSAFMQGLLQLEGDQSVAMSLGDILSD